MAETCTYCGVFPTWGRGDHIIPKCRGGGSAPENLRPSCLRCNHLRAECGHCVGAMACVWAVAGTVDEVPYEKHNMLVRLWGWFGAKAQYRAVCRVATDRKLKGAAWHNYVEVMTRKARFVWPPMASPAMWVNGGTLSRSNG